MEPVICLQDVHLSQGGDFSLKVDSLQLLPHRIYALTGPNGAGKSTLLKALALLDPPLQGRVRFPAAEQASLKQQRQKVTLVEQSPYMLKGTVADNLAFGLKLRGIRRAEQQQRIESGLKLVGLDGFEKRIADQLSGGEQQRVALARALVLKPQVLLLDEPTSNIDSKSLKGFEELLSRLPEHGMTVVMSTHDLTQPKRLGGEMLRIENGRLLSHPKRNEQPEDLQQKERKLWLKPLNVQGL